jgi:hypothetical protein
MNHTIVDLKDISSKNTPFKSIFKEAFKYGFSSQDSSTTYYKQIHMLNKSTSIERFQSISQCYLSIDINKIMYKTKSDQIKYIEKQQVDFLENNEVYSQPVCDYISDCMIRSEVITINVSFENYIYDHDEKTQVTHSVLIILHPLIDRKTNRLKNYNMFYINSHGESLFYTDFHEKNVSGKNIIKKTKFNNPIDFIINNILVKTINNYNSDFDIDVKIHYDFSKQHNYLGINLQSYDNHGACFIFPILFNILIHTNYNKYFINKNNTYSIIVENTVECLLQSKDINMFVYHALSQIDDRINDYLCKYYGCMKSKTTILNVEEELYNDIDEHLCKFNYRFIKSTLTKTMGFIKQDWSAYTATMFV